MAATVTIYRLCVDGDTENFHRPHRPVDVLDSLLQIYWTALLHTA